MTQHDIAANFFSILSSTRDWATGGSNSGEVRRVGASGDDKMG